MVQPKGEGFRGEEVNVRGLSKISWINVALHRIGVGKCQARIRPRGGFCLEAERTGLVIREHRTVLSEREDSGSGEPLAPHAGESGQIT
jgi:hypothetical protein